MGDLFSSLKEGSGKPGKKKQQPRIGFTLFFSVLKYLKSISCLAKQKPLFYLVNTFKIICKHVKQRTLNIFQYIEYKVNGLNSMISNFLIHFLWCYSICHFTCSVPLGLVDGSFQAAFIYLIIWMILMLLYCENTKEAVFPKFSSEEQASLL